MKKVTIATFTLMFLLTIAAYGQSEFVEDKQARDLFKSYVQSGTKGSPGAGIRVELLRQGTRQFVPLTTVFRAGDKVKLHFEVNFSGYVEIYNLGSSGQFQKLFPPSESHLPVKPKIVYAVPNNPGEWFEFDDTAGVEQLSFVFSGVQIKTSRPSVGLSPSTPPKPVKRHEAGIVVNSPAGEKQQAINELNQRALNEGRDLKRVQVENEQYVFCRPENLQQALGVMVKLNHQ